MHWRGLTSRLGVLKTGRAVVYLMRAFRRSHDLPARPAAA